MKFDSFWCTKRSNSYISSDACPKNDLHHTSSLTLNGIWELHQNLSHWAGSSWMSLKLVHVSAPFHSANAIWCHISQSSVVFAEKTFMTWLPFRSSLQPYLSSSGQSWKGEFVKKGYKFYLSMLYKSRSKLLPVPKQHLKFFTDSFCVQKTIWCNL